VKLLYGHNIFILKSTQSYLAAVTYLFKLIAAQYQCVIPKVTSKWFKSWTGEKNTVW